MTLQDGAPGRRILRRMADGEDGGWRAALAGPPRPGPGARPYRWPWSGAPAESFKAGRLLVGDQRPSRYSPATMVTLSSW